MPILDAYKALQWEQHLVGHLIEKHEAFKQSLSDEIYESFNQQLVAALLHLQGFEQKQKENLDEAGDIFRSAMKLLRETIEEARRIANRLKPPVLDDFGLSDSIQQLLDEHCHHDSRGIEFLPSGNLHRISPQIKNAAFRIIQDLLEIARDQVGSEKIRLKMIGKDRCLRIDISNWGAKFDSGQGTETHFRLQKIRGHANLLGGRTVVRRTSGKGTQLVIDLPLAKVDP
jgi:signal transduction histidine kinase